MEGTQSPYAQLFASSTLLKLISEGGATSQTRLELKNFVLTFLFNKGPSAVNFVSTALILLLCRTVKLGWFDDDNQRDIVQDAAKFMEQASVEHYFLGLKILTQLVAEINQPTPGRSLTQHRKAAVSFRDLALLNIFKASLASLQHLHRNMSSEVRLREQALTLALRCLSFDFVGTSLDESTEDLGTIQVPSSWRSLLEDPTTTELFFSIYIGNTPPVSSTALECLVRLASVRRSLFTNDAERTKFLGRLMNGTLEVLRTQKGLDDHGNYHEYCRLLGRLKTNYQLSELVNVENYTEWIQRVAEFTISSLQSWQWASGSVYYLLGLWSRLVTSMPYLKGDSPSLLEAYVPKITHAYITSRMESVQVVIQQNIENDPLDDTGELQDELDSLPYLCRFHYDKTSELIVSMLDPIVAAFSRLASTPPDDPRQFVLLEGQLTWMIWIVGAIVRGRLSSSSAESQEVVDGDLSARMFGLLQVMDSGNHTSRYGERSRQRMDIAMLTFFQNFRKVYVGEQAMHSSKVYTRLSEKLGLQDHLMVLNVTVTKLLTNLKVFATCEEVISMTLNLFQDLAAGYMSGKLLLKIDTINFMLTNHSQEHFPFMQEYCNTRNRTTFYFTLGRLLFMEDTPGQFKAFMSPFDSIMQQLSSFAGDPNSFRSDAVKAAIIGIMRDLRGIAMATNSRKTYGLLFDWIYPKHFPIILRAVEVWTDVPQVTTPVLKFVSEFVLNKTQRLTFECSSPNGILLFREVSKIIVAYGNRILQMTSVSDAYTQKYKGIWICLSMLTRALGGNYVNFGVFELYGDPALQDALNIAIKMGLSIPLNDVLGYRKVGKAYFALLDVLCSNHASFVASQDLATFKLVLSSLEAGLKSLDVSISSQCASAIDSFAGYYFNQTTKGEPPSQAAQNMASHLAAEPNLLPEILKTLFEIILFEDCSNQWSLSRPILSLILINEQFYTTLKMQITSSLPSDKQQKLLGCFDKLMTDVSRTLEPRNRDRFTQNLTVFRHDFRTKN